MIKQKDMDVSFSENFSQNLYKKLQLINPGIANFEFFEFQYALENLIPEGGWDVINCEAIQDIENKIKTYDFYETIKLKPIKNGVPVIDSQVNLFTQMLLKGLVDGVYSTDWIKENFFFDLRSFYFFHRTNYHLEELQFFAKLECYKSFEKKQNFIKTFPDVGYKRFKEANREVDECFIDILKKLVLKNNKPFFIGIAGQTGAGKTEIVSLIQAEFQNHGLTIGYVEIDQFLTDREEREAKGIDSLGKEALHFEFFIDALKFLREGKTAITPQYDFIGAVSSHTNSGQLKPGFECAEIKPADLIFIEGNFPFLYPEVAELIDLKIMYLTDDEIRLKRKWKRDIDYRRKYSFFYFVNRYFREQFLMAESVYIPQIKKCDILVDTTGASIWVCPNVKNRLAEKIEITPQFL